MTQGDCSELTIDNAGFNCACLLKRRHIGVLKKPMFGTSNFLLRNLSLGLASIGTY